MRDESSPPNAEAAFAASPVGALLQPKKPLESMTPEERAAHDAQVAAVASAADGIAEQMGLLQEVAGSLALLLDR
jgi:hypothetical protein